MRILLLCDGLGIGGAETHVATLARCLAARGDEVTVFGDPGALSAGLAAAGVRLFYPTVSMRSFLFWRNFPSLSAFCRAWRPDATHAHTRRTAFLLARLPCTGTRVVTAHARFAGLHRLSYWGERTVAVSADLKTHLCRRFGVPPHRVTVIPNGIDLCRFAPVPTLRDPNVLHAVFASRLDADCSLGAFLLLQCAAQWQEAAGMPLFLTFLGGGDCLFALKTASGPLFPPRVFFSFPGAVADPAVYLRRADLFVGVSRCALEAASCGCAVLLCGNEGFGGLLTPANFARFARGNFTCRGEAPPTVGEMNRAFSAFLREKAAGGAAFSAVSHRVRSRFSAETMAEKTRQVYGADGRYPPRGKNPSAPLPERVEKNR